MQDIILKFKEYLIDQELDFRNEREVINGLLDYPALPEYKAPLLKLADKGIKHLIKALS